MIRVGGIKIPSSKADSAASGMAKKGKKSNVDLDAGTGRERERYALVYGSTLKVREGQHVDVLIDYGGPAPVLH